MGDSFLDIIAVETGVVYENASGETSSSGMNAKLGTYVQEGDASLTELAALGGDSYIGLGLKHAHTGKKWTLELSARAMKLWSRNPRFTTSPNPDHEAWQRNQAEKDRRLEAKNQNDVLNEQRAAAGLTPVPLDPGNDPSLWPDPGSEPEALLTTFDEVSGSTEVIAAEAKLIYSLTDHVTLESALGVERSLFTETPATGALLTGALVYTASSGAKIGASATRVHDVSSGENAWLTGVTLAFERELP